MGLVTEPLTGQVLALRVCAHCEREGGQAGFVASYAKVMRCESVSHGICSRHYQAEIAKLTGDRSEIDAICA